MKIKECCLQCAHYSAYYRAGWHSFWRERCGVCLADNKEVEECGVCEKRAGKLPITVSPDMIDRAISDAEYILKNLFK